VPDFDGCGHPFYQPTGPLNLSLHQWAPASECRYKLQFKVGVSAIMTARQCTADQIYSR
jgi:hypothetical protein